MVEGEGDGGESHGGEVEGGKLRESLCRLGVQSRAAGRESPEYAPRRVRAKKETSETGQSRCRRI